MKNPVFLSMLLVCILTYCKKDDCQEKQISTKHFDLDYGCSDTKHNLQVSLTDSCMIIRSKDSYDSMISGSCHPDIDFSQYDLIIGKQSSGNSVDTIMYDYKSTCPGNELNLTIELVQTARTTPDNIVYHALIPKL